MVIRFAARARMVGTAPPAPLPTLRPTLSPTRPAGLGRTELAALADAGLMPLSDYVALVERRRAR